MEKKGLCVSCVNEKGCVLAASFPVWECNEHSFGQPHRGSAVKGKTAKRNTVDAAGYSGAEE